jgi:xylulokinase
MMVNPNTIWLAFDIGTTGTKAALIDGRGRVRHSAYTAYPTYTADGGYVEQNAADWWKAVIAVCRDLSGSSALGSVEGIALTGQMQNVILVDEDGNPVHPVLLYSDTRARAEAEEINRNIGAERLRELTGNDQGADGLLAKLLWMERERSNVLQSTRHLLLGAADFIALLMTGAAAGDITTASVTGLINLENREFHDRPFFDEVGIGGCVDLLVSLVSGGAVIGTLTDSAARTLGLTTGLPVYLGPGDAGATTIGAGSGIAGRVYAYLGTSGWIGFTAPERAPIEQGAITVAHPTPDSYIQVAPLLTVGGNLEWVRDLFEQDDYDGMIAAALASPPSHLVYLPYLNGERSPIRDPLARGAFVGLNRRLTRVDLCRAVLEGVVYGYRHALEALNAPIDAAITLTGGGSRSEAWCQLFADILKTPVVIADDAENVALRGAALAAQVNAGVWPDYNPPDYFPVSATLPPDREHDGHFDHQYTLFRDLYPALKPIFARML